MKTEQEIRKMLDETVKRPELSYPVATVDENAPLALIQNALEIRIRALEQVLDIPIKDMIDFNELRKIKKGKKK